MLLKQFFLLLFSTCTLIDISAQEPLPVQSIMKSAYEQADKENKKVFMIFHASWCGWCRKMDSSLNDPSVKKFFDKNFVIKHITVYETKGKEHLENPGAQAFLAKFGGSDQGLPFWYIFDTKENLLADSKMQYAGKDVLENTGCPASTEEVTNFIKVLKGTTKLNDEELSLIEKRFRKNEQ